MKKFSENQSFRVSYSSNQDEIDPWLLLIFIIGQTGIAFLARSFPLIATTHAMITIGAGLLIAFFGKKPNNIVYVTAFIVGSEVFWRMTDANIFYESGKYLISAFLLLGLFKIRKWSFLGHPVLYLLLLCVSIPLTFFALGINDDSRQILSFNLSGPLALGISVIYFRQTKLSKEIMFKVTWAIVLGIIPILVIAVFNTITAQDIAFTDESNFLTSGGFGPNQVAAILGLGGTLMFLVAIFSKKTAEQIMAILLLTAFLIQSVLTFSRGGIYNVAICILLASLHLFNLKNKRFAGIVLLFAILLISTYLIIPKLDLFTGGKFTQRFSDTTSQGRNIIARADIQVWLDNFVLGVGPGLSQQESFKYSGIFASAHTEYTRLLADHGVFGLLALVLLIIMAIRTYIKAPGWQSKVWVVVLLAWPIAEMLHAAMRIAAISYLFGLANGVWIPLKNNTPSYSRSSEIVSPQRLDE